MCREPAVAAPMSPESRVPRQPQQWPPPAPATSTESYSAIAAISIATARGTSPGALRNSQCRPWSVAAAKPIHRTSATLLLRAAHSAQRSGTARMASGQAAPRRL